jgi:hypothetical protein
MEMIDSPLPQDFFLKLDNRPFGATLIVKCYFKDDSQIFLKKNFVLERVIID